MPSKIVYLFGSGATHAEKWLDCRIRNIESNIDKDGLLAANVSSRIIESILRKKKNNILEKYGISRDELKKHQLMWGEDPLEKKYPGVDVELLISLIKNIKTKTAENDAKDLMQYFRDDICEKLKTGSRQIIPKLYPALLRWHELNEPKEKLLGFLTVNYDSLIEKSFKSLKKSFDLGFNVENNKSFGIKQKANEDRVPLLKLHGSFNWVVDNDGNGKITLTENEDNSIESLWIPPGLNKIYLDYPYNIIHGRAFELLSECNVLRIVGCSLNQNDINLISLLFTTQKVRRLNPYSIELIMGDKAAGDIAERLVMLIPFKDSFYEIVRGQSEYRGENPFLEWLYYNVKNSGVNVGRDKYLKDIEKWTKL